MTRPLPSRRVLIVTRDTDEASHAQHALLRRGCEVEIDGVRDASEMRALLSVRRAGGQGAGCPDLVVLDLGNSPAGALDSLCALKQDESWRAVPVIVVGSSLPDDEVRAAYRAGAASCVPRGEGTEEFVAAIDALADYWVGLVRLPHAGG